MEIISYHDNGIVEDNSICKIRIEKGILGVYAHANTNYHKLNQPQNDKKWKLEKINWKENKSGHPTRNNVFDPNFKQTYSHKIVYETIKRSTQRIFINPTTEEIIEINSQSKRYWILQPKYQKQILLAVLILVLGWIAKIIFKI